MNAASNIPDETVELKQLVGREDQKSLGSKFIKTGIFIAIAVPEPVVTDIAGAAIIATGYTMNKLTKRATIRDVYTNINLTLKDIKQLKKRTFQYHPISIISCLRLDCVMNP